MITICDVQVETPEKESTGSGEINQSKNQSFKGEKNHSS